MDKKIICLALTFVLLLGLVACGGGSSVRADAALEGRYIPVVGEMMGISLMGDELDGFEVDLNSGGKGTITIEGDSSNISWKNDDSTITLTVSKEEIVGELGTDQFKIKDMLGMGIDLTFAKEGTDAANPENYLPESDKFILGNWQSLGVTDIIGDPIDMDPYSLFMTFNADHTAQIMFQGKDMGTYTWSLLGDWGSLDDEDAPDISWDIKDDGIEVDYVIDDEYYIFDCPKGGKIPDSAFSGGSTDTKGGADYVGYWDGEYYGWWIVVNASDAYTDLDGGYWDVCGAIYLDTEDSGYIYLWDETGSVDDAFFNVDVSFGPGTTDAGSMISEDGDILGSEIGHADFIVDPGSSTVSDYDHMIEIYGTYEDEDGSFDYAIYLRPWGMDWEDVREAEPEMMPYYYDDWYVNVMNDVMPESMDIE